MLLYEGKYMYLERMGIFMIM